MKKTLLIVTICLLQFAAFSQKSKVGIFGGYTSSQLYGKTGGVSTKADRLSGSVFGLLVNTPLGKTQFSFQPALQYAQKGQLNSKTYNTKNFLALRYAELLLNFVYNSKGSKGSFFAGLGPAVALPFPSVKVSKTGSVRSTTAVIFGAESPADYRALDYGANFLIGYKLTKGLFFSGNWTLGARNLIPGDPTNDVSKNSSVSLKIGFLVNNK